jgi:membrane protein
MGEEMIGVFKRAATAFSVHECSTRAAALAFYTVFSLPPALLIAIYVAGLIYGQAAAAGQISAQLESFVGPQAGGQIQAMISNAEQHRGSGLVASLIALAGLIFASTTAFVNLQDTLNRVWSVEADDSSMTSVAAKRVTSFIVVLGCGIVLLASMMFGTVLSAFGPRLPFRITGGLLYVTELLVPFVVISFLVALVFKVLPDAWVEWKDVIFGAIVTAALLVAAKFGMSMYLSHATAANSYSAAGSLAILLLWLYISAAILLLGAVITRASALEHGRDVVPDIGARRIYDEQRPAA